MGFAITGAKGQVYWVDDQCPESDCSSWPLSEASGTCWGDEITRFEVVDSVNKKEYGHDKSHGWQDVCAGIRRLGITLNAICRPVAGVIALFHSGQVVYLKMYPVGVACGGQMQGYAMIDQVSYTIDQETGDPVGYTMTLSSKGPWSGLGSGNWGGFECQCT